MKYKYLKEWVNPKFNKKKAIFFDSETFIAKSSKSRAKGLAFYGDTRLIQIGQKGKVFVYDVMDNPKLLEQVLEYLHGTHLVAHNAIYDFHCPMTNYRKIMPRKVEDTIYIARHAFPQFESFSLGNILFNVGLAPKGSEGSSDWGVEKLSKEQLYYAAYDVYALEKLYKLKPMKKARKTFTCKLDTDNLLLALDYSYNGFPVCESSRLKTLEEKKAAEAELTTKIPEGLNVNSSKQVSELLGTESSGVDVLQTLALEHGNKLAGDILALRKVKKQIGTLEKKWSFERVYGNFNPSGARTGRWTCKGLNASMPEWQNLQQLDRTMKNVFGFEEDNDLYLVDADFTSLEIFGMIATYNSHAMAQVILAGNDVHTETAKLVDLPGRDDKFKRQVAKGLNFSVGYGGGVGTVQAFIKNYAGEVLPEDVVTELRAKWLKKYPEIKEYHDKIGKKFQTRPPYVIVHDLLGRPIRAKSYNEAINTPVQALGAEQTKIALRLLYERLPEVKVVNTVHDSITLECKGMKEAKRQAKILKKCMDDSWLEILPFVCDAAKPLVMNNEAEVLKQWGGEVLWKTT